MLTSDAPSVKYRAMSRFSGNSTCVSILPPNPNMLKRLMRSVSTLGARRMRSCFFARTGRLHRVQRHMLSPSSSSARCAHVPG